MKRRIKKNSSFSKKFLTNDRKYAIIIPEDKRKEVKKMKYDWEEMYDILRDVVGVDENALDLAFGIGGCSEDTACAILNYYTGWKTFEGYLGEFEED